MLSLIDYPESSFKTVLEAKFLEKEDFDNLNSLKDELAEVFKCVQVFRTKTEMEVSVLNSMQFPTPDSKYWQILREQNVMFTELVSLSYEYRKNLVEIKRCKTMLKNSVDKFDKELLEIEIDRLQFIKIQHERVAKDRIRELVEWQNIKETIIPNMQCSKTDVNEHQLVSYTIAWIHKFLAMGSEGDPSERNNIISQLDEGLRICQEKGILDAISEQVGEKLVEQLNSYGLGLPLKEGFEWTNILPQPTQE